MSLTQALHMLLSPAPGLGRSDILYPLKGFKEDARCPGHTAGKWTKQSADYCAAPITMFNRHLNRQGPRVSPPSGWTTPEPHKLLSRRVCKVTVLSPQFSSSCPCAEDNCTFISFSSNKIHGVCQVSNVYYGQKTSPSLRCMHVFYRRCSRYSSAMPVFAGSLNSRSFM